MRFKSFLTMLSCLAALFGSNIAIAQSGENTYKQVCANCHATGVLNAPKFGDKAKWKSLIAEGQVELTGHAYFGVRGMPPKGAAPTSVLRGLPMPWFIW